jgi:hypothetical protein
MTNVVQLQTKKKPAQRSHQELKEIGMKIIASPEFHADIASSIQEALPFCPVAVAISKGWLFND